MSLIVIIDDQAANRAAYGKLALSIDRDIEVKLFADPGSALKLLKKRQPNLIVTDYDMPRMNGEEFILRFRELPHADAVPIIMITASDQRVLRLRALESGATDFLTAPVDHCEFLMRARNLLNLRRASAAEVGHSATDTPGPARPQSSGPLRKPRDGVRKEARPASIALSPAHPPMAAAELESALQRELAQSCGPAGCALHLVDVEPDNESPNVDAVAAALRAQLRGGDWVRRVGASRFAILQQGVVDPGDASACARRLRALCRLGVRVYVGTATSATSGAVPPVLHCAALAALAQDRDGDEASKAAASLASACRARAWRFAPQVDLGSRLMCAAQMVDNLGRWAEARDEAALREAIALTRIVAKTASRFAASPFRVSLRAACAAEAGAPTALRIAPILAECRANPALIDIELDWRDVQENAGRAEMELRALKELGAHITLSVASLEAWTEDHSRLRPTLQYCDQIKYDCRAADEASMPQLGQRLKAWSDRLALPALAAGVTAPALLVPLWRAGVRLAQGPCFGNAFSGDDLRRLLTPPRPRSHDSAAPEVRDMALPALA